MPTVDEIPLATEAVRLRAGGHDVRPHWCEPCREAHVWCGVCGSLSCRHVLETITVPHRA
jgi:hypothetical protein